MSWPAKWGQGGNLRIEQKTSCVRQGSRGASVLWQLVSSQWQKEELVHMGVGRGGVGGEAPTPNKLISANVMFIKFLG